MLITADLKSAMDKLVDEQLHARADVAKDNPHVFALSKGSLLYIRGHDVLRTSSEVCGATRPQLLRSVNLRKHVASMSQILNLKDHELDQLADFMGHDMKIHREFYRLPNDVVPKWFKCLCPWRTGRLGRCE